MKIVKAYKCECGGEVYYNSVFECYICSKCSTEYTTKDISIINLSQVKETVSIVTKQILQSAKRFIKEKTKSNPRVIIDTLHVVEQDEYKVKELENRIKVLEDKLKKEKTDCCRGCM